MPRDRDNNNTQYEGRGGEKEGRKELRNPGKIQELESSENMNSKEKMVEGEGDNTQIDLKSV